MSSIIEGTYKLLAFEVEMGNGEIDYPFGKDAIGYVNYTGSGHFSVQYMPRHQQADDLKGVSYFGTYEYNREKDYIVHHVEGSLFSSEEGLDKIIHARVRGKGLKLTCPSQLGDGKAEAEATIHFEKQEVLPPVTVF
ncbi:lipocalin-like domain-containing protein [Sunxiuqinia sp. sy24]|uniref:lipocalin-like domain-containing protein n=1 Tax=Sunxiuqinia sp. sy24 TaxID=3461495 RepID=UPI004046259E